MFQFNEDAYFKLNLREYFILLSSFSLTTDCILILKSDSN